MEEIEGLRSLHIQSRQFPAPIYWGTDLYDAASVLHNGTCFFVNTGHRTFGITAQHVIAAYEKDRAERGSVHLKIRNTDLLDWDDRRIAADPDCDLATFEVSQAELQEIGATVLAGDNGRWPPSLPTMGRGVFFTGYAGEDRRAISRSELEFLQVSNGLTVEAVHTDEIEVRGDAAKLISIDGNPLPPTAKNLGGFSGAPLLVVSEMHSFWVGGVVTRQWVLEEGRAVGLWAKRLDRLRPDGTVVPRCRS